jgi:hypothetical protein
MGPGIAWLQVSGLLYVLLVTITALIALFTKDPVRRRTALRVLDLLLPHWNLTRTRNK